MMTSSESNRQTSSRRPTALTDGRTLTNYGIATLLGAGATLVAVGLLLPVWGPQPLTIQPCTEDGVTLYDGSCGHPDTAHFTDGYWFQGASDSSGTIAPLRLEKGEGR